MEGMGFDTSATISICDTKVPAVINNTSVEAVLPPNPTGMCQIRLLGNDGYAVDRYCVVL